MCALKFGREGVTDLAVKKLRGCETLASACERETLSGVDSALDDGCSEEGGAWLRNTGTTVAAMVT